MIYAYFKAQVPSRVRIFVHSTNNNAIRFILHLLFCSVLGLFYDSAHVVFRVGRVLATLSF